MPSPAPLPVRPRQPLLPLLLILFIGSGCSALIYEVVWLQLLQLVIGSTAPSLAVLLGTFMGGMCLGSLVLPRLISPRVHPLRVYAALELGTAVFGVAVLFGMPWLQTLYTAETGGWIPAILLRSLTCAICLLPPTVMMGATLPAISRWIQAAPGASSEAASWWGFFYGGNIAGGVAGCLVAGFYLLRVFDMAVASYVAVAINIAVAGLSLVLAGKLQYREAATGAGREVHDVPRVWPVFAAIALSGLCALGAEVVWTRLLSLMLGATVYTFSIILGVFLAGLGLGSSAGSLMAKKEPPARARLWLAGCQAAQLPAILYAAAMLSSVLPYWQGNVAAQSPVWVDFARDLLRCAIAILPSTFLWGAAFPLALAGADANARSGRDSGRLVGEVYAANTVGAILGSIGFSLMFIPGVGTQHSEQILILFSLLAAFVAWPEKDLKTAALVTAAALLAFGVPAIPWKLIGFGRTLPSATGDWQLLYATDGMNSSIAYSKWQGTTTYFHVSGKVEASAEPQDMRLQRLLGHLPALLHSNPKSVLVVGCGAGVTAGSFVVHPEVQHITICEIEPRIPPASAIYFAKENHNVMHDPRTRIVYDDARHFVLTTHEKFDIVTSDPIHPWVKGIAPLYSTEYFELCRQHLNPGGFVTQWVPLYESNVETVRSELATFFQVFPHGSVWGNLNVDGSGYDIVLLGQEGDLKIDLDRIGRRLALPQYQPVVKSIEEVGYNSPSDLLGTYVASAYDLRGWLYRAQINRDRNLRLQYLAGLGLNDYIAPEIYGQIVQRGGPASEIFTGSPERMRQIEAAVSRERFP